MIRVFAVVAVLIVLMTTASAAFAFTGQAAIWCDGWHGSGPWETQGYWQVNLGSGETLQWYSNYTLWNGNSTLESGSVTAGSGSTRMYYVGGQQVQHMNLALYWTDAQGGSHSDYRSADCITP